ncbi:restriction endonuclease [Maribellus maritimus]|nr:restriction endonuclease [Maribellus maritimus]
MSIELTDISIPPLQPTYSDVINHGATILPQVRILNYEDKEWERFIEECTHYLQSQYVSVRRSGGAGDQGLDIVAFRTKDNFEGKWDNYQCKHYDHPLSPSDIYIEMGKLCYYTLNNEYPVPENYFFAAPQGIGTKLGKIIRNNMKGFNDILIENWDKHCKSKITSTRSIDLDTKLSDYIKNFDFSIVKDLSVLDLLDFHRKTPYYHTRFGGGLPSRPKSLNPPKEIAEIEAIYVRKLLDAYAEWLNKSDCSMNDVENNKSLKLHFDEARIQFYCAESLEKFSRDYLESGEFERLQDSIYRGIVNIIISEHPNGFEKVKDTIQEAFKIQIDSHPLKDRLELADRGGICHQLANNDRITWASNDE